MTISIIGQLSLSYFFEYHIEEYLQVSKTFEWYVGEGPLYWYVVESYPIKTECDKGSSCPNPCMSLNVMASSLEHLADRLREQRWNHKVRKVSKWSRPALECDVIRGIQAGIDYSCNTLSQVDFCKACFAEFIHPDDCLGMRPYFETCISKTGNNFDFPVVWYSEYLHVDPIVSVGQKVIQGQKIATLNLAPAFGPHLHFGVGDGCGGMGIGQTIDLDDFFGLPHRGSRPATSPPGPVMLTQDQITYIKGHTIYPLGDSRCEWVQVYGSPFHAGIEYYAQDISCAESQSNINVPLVHPTTGSDVFCACGGPEVESTVTLVEDHTGDGAGWYIYIKHERKLGVRPTDSFGMTNLEGGRITPSAVCCLGDDCDYKTQAAKRVFAISPGFSQEKIQVMKPQVDSIITSCNCTLPSRLTLKHNLNETTGLKEFLARNKLKLGDLDLSYIKGSDSWQNTTHLKGDEQWHVSVNWSCVKDGQDSNWKLHILVTKNNKGKQQKSKVILDLPPKPDKKRSIDMAFTLNTKSQAVYPIPLRSKVIQDEIGLFRGSWGNELKIAVQG